MGNLLVLTYEEYDQRILQTILSISKTSYNVITAFNILEALKFLHKGEFNLIITCLDSALDWNMVSTVRTASKKAPILAIIPENSEVNPRQVLQTGVWKVITTPFKEEDLLNVLQKIHT